MLRSSYRRLLSLARASERMWARSCGKHWLLAWVVVAAALAARLYRLGEESLWIDEAISFGRGRLPLPALIEDCIRRKHVPTYFLLLKGVMRFGDSESMLRLPSVVFGTVTALLAYGLGTVLHGRLAGLVAGLLVAMAALQVHFGQEARMYTLMTMTSSLAMLGLLWLARSPQVASVPARGLLSALRGDPGAAASLRQARRAIAAWLAVGTGTVTALYSHNTAVFFVAALNAAALLVWATIPSYRAGFARNWLACMLLALSLWAWWLPTLLRQSMVVRHAWRGRDPTREWVGGVLGDVYFLGDSFMLSALLFGLGLFALWALRSRKRLGLATFALAFVGTALVFGVSQVVPMFYRRIVLWAAPPWFALVGTGVSYLPRPLAALVIAGLLVLVPRQLAHYYAAEEKPAWRMVIQKLAETSNDHSVILSVGAERFLEYYYNRKSDPLPRRTVKHVRRAKALESYVGNAAEFFVIAQPRERSYKELRNRIFEGNRYGVVARERHGNAVLVQYRLR